MIAIMLAAALAAAPTEAEFDTAVRVAAGEARGAKSDMAVAGVCHVMVNRMLIGAWGDRVDAVVTARLQFSAMNAGDPNRAVVTAPGYSKTRSYKRVRAICATTFAGRLSGYLSDPTRGADHYHSGPKESVPWAIGRTPSAVIGPFEFYDLRKKSKREKLAERSKMTEREKLSALIAEVSQ